MIRFASVVLAVGAICVGCSSAKIEVDYETDSLKPFKVYRPVPDYLTASKRGFDSAPSVTVTRGGRLWVAWHAGGRTEDDENAVLVATSGDGGKTWSEPLFALDAPGPLRGLDPGLWTDPDGRVWLFYAQIYSFWDGRGGVWAMHPRDPERADTDWTPQRRLCDGFLKNKPIVASDGRWLLPVEFMNLDPTEGAMNGMRPMTGPEAHPMPEFKAANVFESRDRGETVRFLGRSRIPVAHRDCTENMVVERKDKSLWMLTRTKYGIGEAESRDGGRTWTETRPYFVLNANSRFFVGRLRSGALLLVKNGPVDSLRDRARGRVELTAYVSDDDGKSWTGGLVLDPRDDVSYPDVAEGADGFIHVVNDHERTKARQIMHHVFTEADVRAGRLVNPASRLNDAITAAPNPEGSRPITK